jgi:hypothetical protein
MHKSPLFQKKPFNNKQLFLHHQQVHQKLEPYQCEQCGKNFSRLSILRQHQRTRHERYRPYQCHICGKSYESNFQLQAHVKKHSEKKTDADGPVKCELCQGEFRFHKNYVKHMVRISIKQLMILSNSYETIFVMLLPSSSSKRPCGSSINDVIAIRWV